MPKEQELDYLISRLKNQTGAAEGSNFPPRLIAGRRVPLVSGLKTVRSHSYSGGTEFTLTWLDVELPNVNGYNVYVTGLLSNNRQPALVGLFKRSPAQFRVESNIATRVTFTVQTVLNNGLVSEIDNSPSCTGITIAPTISVSDLGPGTPGQLITWDATGTPTTIGPGTTDHILVGSGAGAVPQFKSRTTLDLVEGRSTITALGQIVVGSAVAGVVKTLAAGAADSILVGSGAGADAQFKTRTQLDLVEGRANLTTANRVVKVSSSGVVTQASFADSDVVTGAASLTDAGSVPFVASAGVLTDDPTQLFWDDTNNILAIGTNTPYTGSTSKFHVRTAADQNFVFTGPQTLATGVTYHSFNDAVTANVGLEFRGFPIMLFPAGATPGVIVGRQPTTPIGILTVSHHTLGNAVLTVQSVATNDDPTWNVYQNRVATTDATVTTIHTVTIPATTTVALRAEVVARRTGGAAGTAEDGARYELKGVYKNVAGTATLIGAVTKIADEDQAGWDANFTPAGATVTITVTGAVDNNITWHLSQLDYYPVGS